MDEAPRTPAVPTAPGPLASFVRFVVCGGGVGVLSSFAVTLLALSMPWGLANAVITIASTLLCTELHARFTFGAGRRAGRREHWQSAGSAAVAYVVTCAAMLLLHLVQSSPSALTEQIVYLSASGLAGLGRFLVLRLFVFATGRGSGSDSTTTPVPACVPVGGLSGGPRTVTARPAIGGPSGHRLRPAHLPRRETHRGLHRRPMPGHHRRPTVTTGTTAGTRPARRSGRPSGSARNALHRLEGRTARKPRRSGVRVASVS